MILGIAGFDHDGSICLMDGGKTLGHWEWERMCRKRYAGFKRPEEIAKMLELAGIPIKEVSHIAWGDRSCWESPAYIDIRKFLNSRFQGIPIQVFDHHHCHLASAFYASGYPDSVLLSIDGKGDGLSAAWGKADHNGFRIVGRQPSYASIGRVWWALSRLCSYPHFGGAGKVMALGAYGTPRYLQQLLQITDFHEDGTFSFGKSDSAVFSTFRNSERIATWFSNEFDISFADKPQDVSASHRDLAASLQEWSNLLTAHVALAAMELSTSRNLCLAGGVALNIITNTFLREQGIAEEIFVQPATGDSGLSIGAAFCMQAALSIKVNSEKNWSPYLGRQFTDEEILNVLGSEDGIQYARHPNISAQAAKALRENELIGWFQDKEESGPRALGARSLFARPDRKGNREEINKRKKRAPYRPCALITLEEFFPLHFGGYPCPYMLHQVKVKEESHSLLNQGVHEDGSTRIQVVDDNSPLILRQLIREFQCLTGIPALINTSLNDQGHPIVGHPREAIQLVKSGSIDRLFMGEFEIWTD
jgi:carbamoyltransferase